MQVEMRQAEMFTDYRGGQMLVRTFADLINPYLYIHYLFDLEEILECHRNLYPSQSEEYRAYYAPLPLPFPTPDYLRTFFHAADQYLDVPPSVWIEFVWMVQHVHDNRFPLCTHTFIPLVWIILLTLLKLHDDHHTDDNGMFHGLTNLLLMQKREAYRQRELTPFVFHYRNPILQTYLEQQKYLTLEQIVMTVSTRELQKLEEVFLVDIVQFDLYAAHARPCQIPLLECVCASCQVFSTIFMDCKKYLLRYALDVPCIWRANEASSEYDQFTRRIYKFLQGGGNDATPANTPPINNNHAQDANDNTLECSETINPIIKRPRTEQQPYLDVTIPAYLYAF